MLIKQIADYQLILASDSPRRQELIKMLGLNYRLCTDLKSNEDFPSDMEVSNVPVFLAQKKSYAYLNELVKNEILLTADTIVTLNGEILHKPTSLEEAFITLRKLAGNMHIVYTGVFIRSKNKSANFLSGTEVCFDELSDEEIRYYIENYKPFDKAGAYGIQEWIGLIGVKEIKGSYFNVMGLPIQKLYRELENFIK